MNKKIITISILAVLMLITISYATALNTAEVEKKESPLWRIRNNQVITKRTGRLLENIRARFVGENRLVFVPLFGNIGHRTEMFSVAVTLFTCPWLCCK